MSSRDAERVTLRAATLAFAALGVCLARVASAQQTPEAQAPQPPQTAPATQAPQAEQVNEGAEGGEGGEATVRGEGPRRAASDYTFDVSSLRPVPRSTAADLLALAPGFFLSQHGGDGKPTSSFSAASTPTTGKTSSSPWAARPSTMSPTRTARATRISTS